MLNSCSAVMRAASCAHHWTAAPHLSAAPRVANRVRSATSGLTGSFMPHTTRQTAAAVQYSTAQYPGSDTMMAREPITFVNWTLYRTKSALSFKVIKPTFVTGNNGSGRVLDRPGTLLLEFASQVPGRERTYAWEDKLTIGLSPTELHDIVLAPAKGVSVFHDPGKGGPSEGAVTKRFEFKAGTPGSYFMTLTVTDKTGGKAGSVSHSISAAEFSVFSNIVQFLTPRLLGFDQVFE